jgi:dolichol-phosphate mannosyltransferase
VAEYVGTVMQVFEENFEHSEIICVNDDSLDGSLEQIKEVSKQARTTSVSVINMSYFHGLEAAMNAGMDLSIVDFVFEFDHTVMDFEKEEIMNVYRRSLQGYDIVSAVPDRKERITSRMFHHVFDRFTDISYQLHTESFRILSRRVINRISSMNKTIPYRKAIYASQGLKTDSIVYQPKQTQRVKLDKAELGYRSGLAMDSLLLFTEVGYRFSSVMTALMMLITAGCVLYSVVVFLTANPVAGWTTTMLLLSIAFFGLFGILTIVIKYLQLLINLVFKRKYYSFEGIEKLTK